MCEIIQIQHSVTVIFLLLIKKDTYKKGFLLMHPINVQKIYRYTYIVFLHKFIKYLILDKYTWGRN